MFTSFIGGKQNIQEYYPKLEGNENQTIIIITRDIFPSDYSFKSIPLTATPHYDKLYINCKSIVLLTELPADDILELFGKTFFEFCQDSGYDKILQVLGATVRDFLQVSRIVYSSSRKGCLHLVFSLQNLDALHDHLGTLYPGMRAPSFRCTEESDGSLILHYYSERPGLEHIVIGIVRVSDLCMKTKRKVQRNSKTLYILMLRLKCSIYILFYSVT